jgi:circadian clock protein KaiB
MGQDRQQPSEETTGAHRPWALTLFVLGADPLAHVVQERLRAFCEAYLPPGSLLEVVDIQEDPERADAFDVVALPTLIRTSPLPECRVIGDLTSTDKVWTALGLGERPAA